MTVLTKHFQSIEEAIALARKMGTTHNGRLNFFGSDYDGCVKLMQTGVDEYAQRESRELIAKVNAEFSGRTRPEWKASVAGPRVSVPSYISGHPLASRRRKRVESPKAPVRIVVETLVSAGLTDEAIRKRGAAITALVAKLAETRPVELYAALGMAMDGVNTLATIRIQTKPIALSYLCATLNTSQFARGICFAAGKAMARQSGVHTVNGDTTVGWAWGKEPQVEERVGAMRKYLGLAEQDIFLPGGYFSEQNVMIRNPMKWVNSMLATQVG